MGTSHGLEQWIIRHRSDVVSDVADSTAIYVIVLRGGLQVRHKHTSVGVAILDGLETSMEPPI